MRKITRRQFIKGAAIAGGAMMLPIKYIGRGTAYAFAQSPGLQLWKTTLRGVGPGGIPVAAADKFPAPVTKVTHYSITIQQFEDQLHPDLGPTTLWGYNPYRPLGGGSQAQKHLGGIIVAQRGTPIQITFTNSLPSTPIIPIDTTIMGASLGPNRAAVHLHGGFVPWISDGGPHAWFDPNGNTGPSFLNNQVLNPHAPAGDAEYYYPNDQSARLVWYHDHAWGITRINAYSGVASAYLIRDAFELNLQNQGLPPYIEASVLGGTAVLELPIVVQDKIFVSPGILTADPTWPGPTTPGSLWYAHVYDTSRYGKLGPAPAGPPPDPSVVPEFFGDTMLANGTVYPQVTVEPRRYRFRILNACNARFLNLQSYVDDGSANGITLDNQGNPLNAPALNAAALDGQGNPTANFLTLGTEGGFLPSPVFVPSNVPFNSAALGGSLVVAPAERVDVLVDFSPHAGKNIIFYSDAPAPFPGGDPRNDYFPGFNTNKNPVNALTTPGSGPNTRVIMRFQVGTTVSSQDAPLAITPSTDLTAGNDPFLVPLGVTALPPGVPVRQLTLNETFDEHGRLIQLLGTNEFNPATGSFGKAYMDPATETPSANAVEIWQIANLTGDTHPIHFHLVNVQILSRQAFRVSSYKGTPNLMGAPVPPPPQERGWKETVRMNPGEVTTVIMQFKLPANPPHVASIPVSPRTGGFEYVWHCHILEHEEHDMMRPLIVSP